MVLQLRRAHEAHRDARLVFKAAAEGRPLELQRRLVLGKLAGGATHTRITPVGHRVTPLEAASAGGHEDCVKLLRGAISNMKALQKHRNVSTESDGDKGYGCIM